MVIGITGGISTGKSTFSHHLQNYAGGKLFDADRAARQLVDEDAEVRELLGEEFGAEIFSPPNELNRAALRAIVFSDSEKKLALEQILHPRIRRQWTAEAELSRQSGTLFLADIPLLYETRGETLCDVVVVVACARARQEERLIARSSLSAPEVQKIISAQLPLAAKIARADHVVWNNGPREQLERQAEILARLWRHS